MIRCITQPSSGQKAKRDEQILVKTWCMAESKSKPEVLNQRRWLNFDR